MTILEHALPSDPAVTAQATSVFRGLIDRIKRTVSGTVSNVAARLCDEALPEQILISPRVLMAVEDMVTVELIRELSLKGIRRSVTGRQYLWPH